MSIPVFYSPYIRPDANYEINSGEEIVEKAGYVPANVLIENMIYAGNRLDFARSEYYDFADAETVDQDFIDPTRSKGFDIADASYMLRSAQGRIAEQKKIFESEEVKRKEAERKIEDDKKGEVKNG